MTVVSRQVHIALSPDRVFAYLTDIERHVEWSGQLSFGLAWIEKVTPGKLRKGSVFKSAGLLSPKANVEDTSTVTEVLPPSRLAWETTSSGGNQQNTFNWAYTLEPRDGGTALTYTLEQRSFSPKPLHLWIPPLLWFVDRQIFGREMAGGLQKIKEALES